MTTLHPEPTARAEVTDSTNPPGAQAWPILTRYRGDALAKVALPLGGIGTGTVSFGGRGDLRDWEIVNRPAKGFVPSTAFLALWARPLPDGAAGQEWKVARALEGPIDDALYEGPLGAVATHHGLPRFRDCVFEAAYPFGQVVLSDPEVPLGVRLQAWNPLIPGDATASGLPVAVLRVVLDNPAAHPVEASVAANLQNFIGSDGHSGASRGNVNEVRESPALRGVFFRSNGVNPAAEQWGTMTLAVLTPHETHPSRATHTADSGAAPATEEQGDAQASEAGPLEVTYRTAWPKRSWGNTLLDFWDDFSDDGRLDERPGAGVEAPVGSVAARLTVPAGGSAAVTFLLTWHFPNRQSWTPHGEPEWIGGGRCASGPPTIGNEYTTRFADAWAVAEQVAAQLPALEARTRAFVTALVGSDLPPVVVEAALYNLSTLRSQTCFRTADGHFYGWEGCFDHTGSCYGNCTHVWNYEQATAFLFGDLARDLRRLEFLHATRDDGHMAFRLSLPLDDPQAIAFTHDPARSVAAADGQMGCLMKLYRDWQLSGDDAFLQEVWPRARAALAYCWIPGGWDADQDGVMEGCQHNTMDVEYYGPNPQMGGWYLGALRAGEELARHLGDTAFADRCHSLFEQGRDWLDAHLFNGEYYEHHIRPVPSEAAIAPGLRHPNLGSRILAEPELQLGAGCLVDQLVGQYLAHVCGLGYLLEPEHVRTTLQSILRYNHRSDFFGHFNAMRSFVMGNESALLMASYPRGRRPAQPFPYYSEVMTGFEYTAAVHLLYEGETESGVGVIRDIRARYDGRRRSPFDEAECGHHYARAMASWGAILALTGFHYSAVEGHLTFAAATRPACWFWSNGSAWGTIEQRPGTDSATGPTIAVHLTALSGTLTLCHFSLTGPTNESSVTLDPPVTLAGGQSYDMVVLGDFNHPYTC